MELGRNSHHKLHHVSTLVLWIHAPVCLPSLCKYQHLSDWCSVPPPYLFCTLCVLIFIQFFFRWVTCLYHCQAAFTSLVHYLICLQLICFSCVTCSTRQLANGDVVHEVCMSVQNAWLVMRYFCKIFLSMSSSFLFPPLTSLSSYNSLLEERSATAAGKFVGQHLAKERIHTAIWSHTEAM